MSRSYNKARILTDYSKRKTKFYKKQANKKVRKSSNLKNGRLFKKLYESWNIFDYKCKCYKNETNIDEHKIKYK